MASFEVYDDTRGLPIPFAPAVRFDDPFELHRVLDWQVVPLFAL